MCKAKQYRLTIVDQLEYDLSTVTYQELLTVFYNIHDPITLKTVKGWMQECSKMRSVLFHKKERDREAKVMN